MGVLVFEEGRGEEGVGVAVAVAFTGAGATGSSFSAPCLFIGWDFADAVLQAFV